MNTFPGISFKAERAMFFSVAALLCLLLMFGCSETVEKPANGLPVLHKIPDFSLVERSGAEVTGSDLSGKIWIADFIFTNCAGPCPIMTAHMKDLQTALSASENVRLVSVSVDPQRDTPKVLSDYADTFEADPERWLFLTGEKENIFHLAKTGLKLVLEDANEEHTIIHSPHFVLIDPQGHVRGYYNSFDEDFKSRIILDVERLKKEEISS